MSKKIICSIAPILVLVVFVVAPSVASATARAYGTCIPETGHPKEVPCKTGEKFTAFFHYTPEKAVSKSSSAFVLETETTPTKGVECKTATYKQTIENIENEALEVVGTSKGQLAFGECSPINLGGCTEVNPKTNHEIIGEVSDQVVKNGKEVEVSLQSGFNLKCVIAEKEVEFGSFSGLVEGKIIGNKLEFAKVSGLNVPSVGPGTITGAYATETETGKESVFVGESKGSFPPSVTTKPASSVTAGRATLNGIVDPEGPVTKYYFEYGKTTSYGSNTTELSAGSGIASLEESQAITGLKPETTYHFRIVAKNGWGSTDGADVMFTTTTTSGIRTYGTCAAGTPESKPPCAKGEKFTAFPLNTPEKAVSKSSSAFVLETETTPTKGVECKTATYKQTIENIENEALEVVGTSKGQLAFGECSPINLGGCTEVNPKTNHEIIGEVSDQVVKNGKEVEVSLQSGFNLKCVIAEKEVEFGSFSGLVEGKIIGNKLEFAKVSGLNVPSVGPGTITGAYATETETGKKPVFIE